MPRNHSRRYTNNPRADCNQITLPPNLLLSGGTLWEDFETIGDWTIANGSAAANTTQFKTGTQSIKLTANAAATATMTKTVNWDLSGNWGGLSFWFYVHSSDPTDFGTNVWTIKLGNNSGLSNRMYCSYYVSQLTELAGWHRAYVPKAYFEAVASGTFASPIIRIQFAVDSAAGRTPSISFDDVEVGETHQPAFLLRHDDDNDAIYSISYAYLKAHNFRGTYYVNTGSLGTGGAHSTWPHLQEMYAAGWNIANHTRDHTSLVGVAEATQEAAINNCIADLAANGMPKYTRYFAYPGGGATPYYDANTYTAMTNCGILTAHNTYGVMSTSAAPHGYQPLVLPELYYGNLLHLFDQSLTNTMSLATMKAMVDLSISAGSIFPTLIHHPDGQGVEITQANFQALMDYVIQKAKAGLAAITIDDLYNLSLGPVKVPRVV